MNIQELKVNYKKLLNKAAKANGRKETISYLNRAAKIKSRIYSNTKVSCFRCLVSRVFTCIFNRNFTFDKLIIFWVIIQEIIISF